MSDDNDARHVINLKDEPMPRFVTVIGTALIEGRALQLALASGGDPRVAPYPMVIDRERQLAWIGHWDSLLRSAANAIAKAAPLH